MEMKRELYSNSLKELEAATSTKSKSSIYFKVIVPRKTRIAQGAKDKAENTVRNKSISSTSKRKFTLEGEVQQKDSLLSKSSKEIKGKIEYNPVSSYKPLPNVENPFSPGRGIAANKDKNSSQKHGRLSALNKAKATQSKPSNKRTGNLTRKELRIQQLQDKNLIESDNEEPNIGYNKHLLSSVQDESKQTIKNNPVKIVQKINRKLINKSNFTKNSTDLIDSRGSISNVKSTDKISTMKQSTKIRPQLKGIKEKISKQILKQSARVSKVCENYGIRTKTKSIDKQQKQSRNQPEKTWKPYYYQNNVFNKQDVKPKYLSSESIKSIPSVKNIVK